MGIGNIKIKGSCDWLHWSFKVIYINFSETEKPTYFTAAYRSDQDIKDTLLLGEHVIKAFKSDHPDVVECDNASSYHGNFYPESLYHICKQNGITLWQLHHNQSQKGKDQCNQESAVARNMMRCFVDEGNNILTVEDIYEALVNSKMKNTKVSAVSFQKNECEVDGDKIINIYLKLSLHWIHKGRHEVVAILWNWFW